MQGDVNALYTQSGIVLNIGLPSAVLNNSDNTPWEILADLLGGVKRNYYEKDKVRAENYYLWSRIIGPFWWW